MVSHDHAIKFNNTENVGFDIRDDIKLFDFGLAKELHDEDKDAEGLYKLTGVTGSPIYMAPGKPLVWSLQAFGLPSLTS